LLNAKKRQFGLQVEGGDTVSLEENKAIVRRLYEAYNEQNLALFDELYSPDYVNATLQIQGVESAKQFITKVYKGFPDWHETVEDIIAEGDKVWVHVKLTGTHTGEYRGLAPTGKKIAFSGMQIWRIANGKIVANESVFEFLDFYKQLGVIDYKGFPDEVK